MNSFSMLLMIILYYRPGAQIHACVGSLGLPDQQQSGPTGQRVELGGGTQANQGLLARGRTGC